MKETKYSRKVSQIILQNLSTILQNLLNNHTKNIIITITHIRTATDLSISKIYFTILLVNLESKNTEIQKHEKNILHIFEEHSNIIKNELGKVIRKKIKKIPNLIFILDDSKSKFDSVSKIISDPNF